MVKELQDGQVGQFYWFPVKVLLKKIIKVLLFALHVIVGQLKQSWVTRAYRCVIAHRERLLGLELDVVEHSC